MNLNLPDTNEENTSHLLQSLLTKMENGPPTENTLQVEPMPGYVLKTHIFKPQPLLKTKLFINLCQSPFIPAPPLMSDDELQAAIGSGDNSSYRVPLSLSAMREDVDKSGNVCKVVDACVNTDPFDKSIADEDFKMFLMELCLQWIEQKHEMELSRGMSLYMRV